MTDRNQAIVALAEALRAAGFEPDSNVCESCGHHGSDHDLGNWCLTCPRPDGWDRTAKSPTGAKVDAGWCYFASPNDHGWGAGMSGLFAALTANPDAARTVAAALLTEEALAEALVDTFRAEALANWPWLRGDGWPAYSEHGQPEQVLLVDKIAAAILAALGAAQKGDKA